MDIQTRKIAFIQEFLRLENEEIILLFENLLKEKQREYYQKRKEPLTLDQFNREIDQALEDSKKGDVISVNELLEKIRLWD